MIRYRFPFIAMLVLLLAACSPASTVAPTSTPTATIVPTETKVPTPTATITPSPTPIVTSTNTPRPTYTPAPTRSPTPYPQASFVHPVDLSDDMITRNKYAVNYGLTRKKSLLQYT